MIPIQEPESDRIFEPLNYIQSITPVFKVYITLYSNIVPRIAFVWFVPIRSDPFGTVSDSITVS